jgi:Arc/MetJ-type ribon-helix-helix transcriptional regulator
LGYYRSIIMAKVCVEIPDHIIADLSGHVGQDRKFVNLSDAIRTACRRMLDGLDDIDKRHGRGVGDENRM